MKLATQIFLGFLIAISIDLLDSFVNYTLTLRVRMNSDFLNKSEAIIRNSADLNKEIVLMQSGFRGFLLTGDEKFLEHYEEGLTHVPALAREEEELVISPGQRSLLDSIVWLHERWVAYAGGFIKAKRKATGYAGAVDFRRLLDTQFRRGMGKEYNDRIAGLFHLFDDAEYRERNERRVALSSSIDHTDKYSLSFSILLLVVGVVIAVYLVRKISTRIRSLVGLAERISSGNFGMVEDHRKDELSSLSVSLNLMSARLESTIGELEKKNKELSAFAYVVSHDLKAPVRGIGNVVRWINEDLSTEISMAMRKFLDVIVDRLARMEGLIDGLLAYARAGSHSVVEKVNVEEMVRELADTVVPKEYSVQLGTLPTFSTERLLLQQVLGNLISNAVKYTPAGEAIIQVTCREQAGWYEFSVKDNGPGISPEFHEKVFGLFQTLREKEDKESTGIGLAIVRKIVEEKGGAVRLVSDVGEGATFIFTWPKQST